MRRTLALSLSVLALTACAPFVQKPSTAPVEFSGPHLETDTFVSFDGARLGLRVWPAQGEPKAVLAGLHGMSDYSAAFRMVAPYLAEHGVTVYALDQRGFGRSPNPGLWPGEKLLVEDAAAFVAAVQAANPGKPVTVMGISMGGAVAIRAAAEHKIAPDRLILAAPAVWGWSTIPKTYGAVLWLAAHTAPGQIVRPSKNIKIVASDNNKILYENWLDPLFQKNTRIDSVYGLVELMEDAADSVGKLPPNTLYLYGAKDQVIPPAATLRAARRLPPSVRSIYYPDGYHMLTRDLHGPLVWADILSFIENPDAPPPSGLGPIPNAPKNPMQFVEKKPEIAPASPEKTPQNTPMAAAKDPVAGAPQGNP